MRHGQAVIFPTDTVYGIGCNATQSQAVDDLFSLTDREPNKGMVILCNSLSMIESYADLRFSLEKLLIENYMPGPLTLILDSKQELPELLEQSNGTIGVRIPDHDLCLGLISALGNPIATKSANRAGMPAPSMPDEIDPYFVDQGIYILEDGVTDLEMPSTIVRVLDEKNIYVIREGAIPVDELYEYIENLD